MSCSCVNRYFYQTLNFETCQRAEHASSTDSLLRMCQIKYKENNNMDGETHEHCKECIDSKCNVCAAMHFEEAYFSDTNNNNAVTTNEGNITIANEQRYFEGLDAPMMIHCD